MNWQLEIYQWVVPLITLYYIVRTVKQYGNGKYSPRNTVIWILFWLSITLLALVPDKVTNSIARSLGFKDHINALIFVVLAVLILMVFYLSAAVNRIEDKMTELVRRIALEKVMDTYTPTNSMFAENKKIKYTKRKKKQTKK